MKLSITQILVAAFLGLTLLVPIATLGLARWSFEQGFLDYVNALEQTRLERVRADLVDEYLSAGSNWDSLTEQRFTTLMLRSAPQEPNSGPPPGGMQGRPGTLENIRRQWGDRAPALRAFRQRLCMT